MNTNKRLELTAAVVNNRRRKEGRGERSDKESVLRSTKFIDEIQGLDPCEDPQP